MAKLTCTLAVAVVASLMASPALAGKFDFKRDRLRGPLFPTMTYLQHPSPVPEVPGPHFTPGPISPGPSAPGLVSPGPAPLVHPGPTVGAQPLPMMTVPVFHRVEYEDLDNIHPCAEPMIVAVPDPCACDCGRCGKCCLPQCVFIEICVPTCRCGEIKVRSKGRRIEYDYGKYEVEISVRKGYVKVDYDD